MNREFAGCFHGRGDGTAAPRWNHTGAPFITNPGLLVFLQFTCSATPPFCVLQVQFHFTSQLVLTDTTFPRAIQNLIASLPVTELELAFVHGRWV